MAVSPTTGNVFVSSTDTVTEMGPNGIDIASATVDGVQGIAVVGSDVYVTSPSGIVELDASGLQLVATFPVVAAGPDLVYAGSDLWTASGTNLSEVSLTGTATTFDDDPALAGPDLLGDPSDPDLLFSYDPSANPVTISEVDVSDPTAATFTQSDVDGGAIGDVQDAAVSPDGSTLMTAPDAPSNYFVGLSTSADLTGTAFTYPSADVPTAVAMTSGQGGLFAGGTTENAGPPDSGLGAAGVFVWTLGQGNLINLDSFWSSVPYADPAVPATEIAPGGLAFSPDGSLLYAVVEGGDGGFSLNVVPTATPAPSPGLGDMTGTVTNGSTGVEDACVIAVGLDSSGITAQYDTQAEADGEYYINDMVPGRYAVEFDPTCDGTEPSNYATQFYSDEPDYGAADAVTVASGNTVTGIDAVLSGGTTISGTVSDQTGDIASDPGCVYAFSASDGYEVGSATMDGTGAYSISNLPAASYVLLFDPTCAGTNPTPAPDAAQYSGDATSFGAATPVSTTSGDQTADAVLPTQSTIAGVVTAENEPADGNAGICVEAIPTANDDVVLAQAVTANDGSYTIGNLPAGSYYVAFDPTCGGLLLSDFSPQFYPDAQGLSGAAWTSLGVGGSANLGTASLALVVAGPEITTTSALTAGALNTSYFLALGASDGTSGWTWTVSGLPAGLTAYSGLPLTGEDSCDNCGGGIIYGTPSASGDFTVTITATDSSNPPLSTTERVSLDVTGGTTTTTTTPAPTTTSSSTTTTTTPSTTTTTTTPSTTTTTAGGGGGAPPGGGGGGGAPPASPTTTATTPSTSTTTPSTSSTTGVTTTTAPTTTTTLPTLPPGSLTTTIGASGTTFSNKARGVSASVKVPAGALPVGTKITISPISNAGTLTNELPPGQAYVVAFAVSWSTPEGKSPAATAPITMTIVDAAIKAGDTIYLLTPSGLQAVGVATVNGRVTITFTTDPEFVVAAVPRITGTGSAASLKGSDIAVELSCGPAIKCSGVTTLTALSHGGTTVTLAQGRFTVAAGKTETVPFTETTPGKAFLKDHKDIVGQLEVTLMGGTKSTHHVRVP
jgi:hypothetical protein